MDVCALVLARVLERLCFLRPFFDWNQTGDFQSANVVYITRKSSFVPMLCCCVCVGTSPLAVPPLQPALEFQQ